MKNIFKLILKTILLFLLILTLLIGGFLGFIYNKYLKDLTPIETLQKDERNKDYIFYKDIPEKIIKTSVSIEDRYYFNRDFIKYKINLFKKVFSENIIVGTSSIHHLLIRELLKNNNLDLRGIERILVWNYYSDLLFKKYTKEKILEMYLNKIIFLEDGTKLKNIGEKLFNKKLSEINNFEISIILSLPKSPKGLSPYKNYNNLMGYFYIDGTYNSKTKKYEIIDDKKITKKYFEELKKINISRNEIKFKKLTNLEIKNGNNIVKYNYGRKGWILFRMYKEGLITFKDFKEIIIKNYKYKFK